MTKLLTTSSKIVLEKEIVQLRTLLPSAILSKSNRGLSRNTDIDEIFANNSYFAREWSPFGLSPFRREIRALSAKNFSNYVGSE